jgi:hypothetical protein
MSRRRQRAHSSDSEDDEALNPRTSAPSRRYRPRVAPPLPPRDFRQDMAWFAPILALFGIGAPGNQRLTPGLLERMQLMRPDLSGPDKQRLIDATTIVCTYSGTDEVQCGICLQTLEQGVQLRMAQYVQRYQHIMHIHISDILCMCCHKFHDDCLTEWFKVIPLSLRLYVRAPLTFLPPDTSRLPTMSCQAFRNEGFDKFGRMRRQIGILQPRR